MESAETKLRFGMKVERGYSNNKYEEAYILPFVFDYSAADYDFKIHGRHSFKQSINCSQRT